MNRFFIAGILATLAAVSCSDKEKDGRRRPPVPVRTAAAARQTFTRTLEATGEVAALQTAVISSITDGRITCCLWVEGDVVRAGQTLYQIEREAARRETDIARQAYYTAAARTADVKAGFRPEEVGKMEQEAASAREQLAFQEKSFQRLEKLVEAGSASRESLEKARVDLVNARSRLEIAMNQLQIAKTGPTRTQVELAEAAEREAWAKLQQAKSKYAENLVEAPFSGTITRVLARPGDTVSARVGLLEISDLEKLVIRFSIPERMALQVRLQAPVRVTFDAHPQKVFSGKVTRLFPVIDEKTRVLWAHAELDESVRLLPGMFARVGVILEETPDSLVLPESAVVQTHGGEVYVLAVQGKKVKKVPVKVSGSSGGFVRVLEGIAAGDVVVSENADQLRDGQEVVPLDSGGGPAPKAAGASSSAGGGVPGGSPAADAPASSGKH